MFLPEEFVKFFVGKSLNIIYSISQESRADNSELYKEITVDCQCNHYPLDYIYERDIFHFDGRDYNLRHDIYSFLDNIDFNTPILLDITSMNLRLLGSFLHKMKRKKCERVYCLYTEPGRYCKNMDADENIDHFDLYKKFKGIEAIPGFLRENDNKLPTKYLAFLGFDGKRIEQYGDIYGPQDIVPIITLPSYKPGWHNHALHENLDWLASIDRKPEYVIANSYLSSYNYLAAIYENNPKSYIRVIPLGTKINALGVLLFALNHTKRIDILYDNPIQEGKFSSERGKTYIFDISDVLSYNGNT